jgi:hypothetical protein
VADATVVGKMIEMSEIKLKPHVKVRAWKVNEAVFCGVPRQLHQTRLGRSFADILSKLLRNLVVETEIWKRRKDSSS